MEDRIFFFEQIMGGGSSRRGEGRQEKEEGQQGTRNRRHGVSYAYELDPVVLSTLLGPFISLSELCGSSPSDTKKLAPAKNRSKGVPS